MHASAAALGAAIALLPAPVGRHAAPPAAVPVPPAQRVPVDPLAAHVLERMPSLSVDEANRLATTVRSESVAARLDPVLVMAVIGVESGWVTSAVSERGARGLMQLRRLALEGEEREAGVAPGDPHDPVHNVRMGIRYLARMVAAFPDPDLALVAYNSGPTRTLAALLAVDDLPESMLAYPRKVRREEKRIRQEMLRAGHTVADASR